ncbi:MAG: cation transporter [Candidatus Omnitrophica bacterium]|nr:cation transporter [Candidatus Omnitrophota bacterium]
MANHKNNLKEARIVLILTFFLNLVVAFTKIFYGIFTKSYSMLTDGFHSFSDGTSNIIGLISLSVASKPIDEKHPYGHKKYETFAAITIALFLFFIVFNVIKEAIYRFYHPIIPEVNPNSFLVMIFTILLNLAVMKYEYSKGNVLKSDILIADSQHTKSDVLTSLSVILGLLFVKAGYPLMDTIASLFIAGFIARAGFKILKYSSGVLCDEIAVDKSRIENIVNAIDGVRRCHKIRTRGRRDDIHIDLHVLVDPDMHVDKAHDLSYRIEDAIKKNIEGASDVLVHIEPIPKVKRFAR